MTVAWIIISGLLALFVLTLVIWEIITRPNDLD